MTYSSPVTGLLVRVQAADRLVQRVQDGGLALGEQVAVDVLSGLDLGMPHLTGYLHVGCPGGDEQGRADVA